MIHVVRRRAKPKEPRIIYVDDDEPPEPQIIYLNPGPQEPPQIIYASQPNPQIILKQQRQSQPKVIYLNNNGQQPHIVLSNSNGGTRSVMSNIPDMNNNRNSSNSSQTSSNNGYLQPQIIYLNQEPQQYQYVLDNNDNNYYDNQQPQIIYLNGDGTATTAATGNHMGNGSGTVFE